MAMKEMMLMVVTGMSIMTMPVMMKNRAIAIMGRMEMVGLIVMVIVIIVVI